jgi:protein-tyrosine phosphatase
MQPSTYAIPLDMPGRLYVMAKPSSDWLQEDIAAWRLMGIDRIVSLLTPGEEQEMGLAAEAEFCRSKSLDFLSFPIPDRGLAEAQPFATLARRILDELLAGRAVGIHCRAGIGRSGMLACCILKCHGVSAEAAIARVSHARGVPVPDTDEQAAFIHGFRIA